MKSFDMGKIFGKGKGYGKTRCKCPSLSCGVETSRRDIRNPLYILKNSENTGVLGQRRLQGTLKEVPFWATALHTEAPKKGWRVSVPSGPLFTCHM